MNLKNIVLSESWTQMTVYGMAPLIWSVQKRSVYTDGSELVASLAGFMGGDWLQINTWQLFEVMEMF